MQESLLTKQPSDQLNQVVEYLSAMTIPLEIEDSKETIVCTLLGTEVRLQFCSKGQTQRTVHRVITLPCNSFPSFLWNIVRTQPQEEDDENDDEEFEENDTSPTLRMQYPDTPLIWDLENDTSLEDIINGPVALMGKLRVSNNVCKRSELQN